MHEAREGVALTPRCNQLETSAGAISMSDRCHDDSETRAGARDEALSNDPLYVA
jgi:hypothetical protein